MKRILVYGLSNGFGGVETILLNIMKYSDKAILQFDFIVSAGQECLFAPIIEANGGKIHRVKPWGQGPIRHKNDLKMIFSQEQPYDYVWINTASASNISMQLATRQFSDAKIIVLPWYGV
jgi:hypothetical protein